MTIAPSRTQRVRDGAAKLNRVVAGVPFPDYYSIISEESDAHRNAAFQGPMGHCAGQAPILRLPRGTRARHPVMKNKKKEELPMKTEKQYKDLTIREFTKAADTYESSHAGIYEMCKEDYPYISGELAKENYTDLLDCGCGPGPMITLLHEANPDRRYTGIDITPKMIEIAKAKQLPGTSWVVGDCENLPFEDNSFDAVICSNSFHHYPNPQRFFDSVWRVLRPGGRLILQDYTAPGPVLWLMNHTEMPLANLIGHGDVGAYSLDQVREFCRKAGLRVEKLERAKKFRLHLVARKGHKGWKGEGKI